MSSQHDVTLLTRYVPKSAGRCLRHSAKGPTSERGRGPEPAAPLFGTGGMSVFFGLLDLLARILQDPKSREVQEALPAMVTPAVPNGGAEGSSLRPRFAVGLFS